MPDTGERTTGSRAQDTLIGLGAALLGAAVLLVTGWLIMRQRGASTTRR